MGCLRGMGGKERREGKGVTRHRQNSQGYIHRCIPFNLFLLSHLRLLSDPLSSLCSFVQSSLLSRPVVDVPPIQLAPAFFYSPSLSSLLAPILFHSLSLLFTITRSLVLPSSLQPPCRSTTSLLPFLLLCFPYHLTSYLLSITPLLSY